MTESDIAASAQILADARRTGQLIDALPVTPASIAEAHAIQDRVVALLGITIGAFKANAPPGAESSRGWIDARTIHVSPARMSPAEVPHLGVEGEIAFRVTRDLPAREASYTREEIAKAVAVLPAIEVVSSRFREPRARPPLEQLADCGINGGLVLGPETTAWSQLDIANLRVTLFVNDEPVLQQQATHPTGDPLSVAVALVNMMNAAGGVRKGQIIITGSWTGMLFLKPGDRCAVEFETLGRAEVVFDS